MPEDSKSQSWKSQTQYFIISKLAKLFTTCLFFVNITSNVLNYFSLWYYIQNHRLVAFSKSASSMLKMFPNDWLYCDLESNLFFQFLHKYSLLRLWILSKSEYHYNLSYPMELPHILCQS